MAIKRQQNWLGQQRVDVADLRSIESAVTNDFDVFAGKIWSGRAPLVVRGFTISTTNAAGNPADELQLSVAAGLLMHFGASESGTIFSVDDDAAAETLSSDNEKVVGSFTADATNYIGIDLRRSEDDTTADLKQFLDANTQTEIPKTVPTARTLSYRIIISTQPFSASSVVCPIAKVVTSTSNTVVSVTDSRKMLFRLGSGGDAPDAASSYTWQDSDRKENAIVFEPPTSADDPFTGGDKEITNLKDWMDAVMSRLWELGSGQFWYSPTSRDNTKIIFGPNVFVATGDNFKWTLGTNTLEWQDLQVAFENSDAYYNSIADGGAQLTADGQCLYVDLQRDTEGASLVPAVAELASLGSPNIPGSRFIIAWRHGDEIHIKDKPYEVGRTFPVATTTTVGDVRLNADASDNGGSDATPTVPIVNSSGEVVGTGLSRAAASVGDLNIGTTANDDVVAIGRTGNTATEIYGNTLVLQGTVAASLVATGGDLNIAATGVVSIGSSGATTELTGDIDIVGTIVDDVLVDAAKNYKYDAAVTRHMIVSPAEFHEELVGTTTSNIYKSHALISHANGSSAVDIFAQIHVPAGATVTDIEFHFTNLEPATSRSVSNIYLTRKTYDVSGSFTETDLVSGSSFSVLALADGWYSPLSGVVSTQIGDDSLLSLRFQIPSMSGAGVRMEFRGVRVTYTMDTVAPTT